jgi:hypothetical protein
VREAILVLSPPGRFEDHPGTNVTGRPGGTSSNWIPSVCDKLELAENRRLEQINSGIEGRDLGLITLLHFKRIVTGRIRIFLLAPCPPIRTLPRTGTLMISHDLPAAMDGTKGIEVQL